MQNWTGYKSKSWCSWKEDSKDKTYDRNCWRKVENRWLKVLHENVSTASLDSNRVLSPPRFTKCPRSLRQHRPPAMNAACTSKSQNKKHSRKQFSPWFVNFLEACWLTKQLQKRLRSSSSSFSISLSSSSFFSLMESNSLWFRWSKRSYACRKYTIPTQPHNRDTENLVQALPWVLLSCGFQLLRTIDPTGNTMANWQAEVWSSTRRQGWQDNQTTCRSLPIALFENSTLWFSFSSISCLSHCDREIKNEVTAGISSAKTNRNSGPSQLSIKFARNKQGRNSRGTDLSVHFRPPRDRQTSGAKHARLRPTEKNTRQVYCALKTDGMAQLFFLKMSPLFTWFQYLFTMHRTASSVVWRCSSCSILCLSCSSALRRCSIRSTNFLFWNWRTFMSISSCNKNEFCFLALSIPLRSSDLCDRSSSKSSETKAALYHSEREHTDQCCYRPYLDRFKLCHKFFGWWSAWPRRARRLRRGTSFRCHVHVASEIQTSTIHLEKICVSLFCKKIFNRLASNHWKPTISGWGGPTSTLKFAQKKMKFAPLQQIFEANCGGHQFGSAGAPHRCTGHVSWGFWFESMTSECQKWSLHSESVGTKRSFRANMYLLTRSSVFKHNKKSRKRGFDGTYFVCANRFYWYLSDGVWEKNRTAARFSRRPFLRFAFDWLEKVRTSEFVAVPKLFECACQNERVIWTQLKLFLVWNW